MVKKASKGSWGWKRVLNFASDFLGATVFKLKVKYMQPLSKGQTGPVVTGADSGNSVLAVTLAHQQFLPSTSAPTPRQSLCWDGAFCPTTRGQYI